MLALGVPVGGVEQRRARRIKKFRCLSPQGEFLNFPPSASSARQPRYSGASEPGSPFLCLLSFGEAKESECAVGRISRRGGPNNDTPSMSTDPSTTSGRTNWELAEPMVMCICMRYLNSNRQHHHAEHNIRPPSHIVSEYNSRPINMRRISDVPAPISYSLASRHSRPSGYSLM
ncbi:MAG: hypothetical protein RIS44_1193 [Pseudomonadota bacterium]